MGVFDWLLGKQKNPAARTPTPTEVVPRDRQSARVPSFAIVDVETTGLSPRQNRILELAVVRVDGGGTIIDEWSTRINPEGPVGATHIHGITQADVARAPLFREVASGLIPFISGVPIVAHNAKFDLAFLRAEFQRAGWDVPRLPSFCTLDGSREYLPALDRRRLADCCWAAGVALENAHSALGDARATAGLLRFYLGMAEQPPGHDLHSLRDDARMVVWPATPSNAPIAYSPDDVGVQRPRPKRITPPKPKQPSLLRQLTDLGLLEAVEEGAPQGSMVYLETLLDALEDGEITDDEAAGLEDLIDLYDLTTADLRAAHRAFILALAHKAVDDGRVSADERAELHGLSDALDVPRDAVNELIAHAEAARVARMSAGLSPLPDSWNLGVPLRVGDKVAFTGCDERQRLRLEQRATELGVRVMNNVSRLTAMLVTDGTMDSTKLAKALQVGIRIVHPDTFETLLSHLQPALSPPERPRPSAARPLSEPAIPRTASPESSRDKRDASPGVVRSWAIDNGYTIGVRGRISSDIWDAFAAAQMASDSTTSVSKDVRVESFDFQGEQMAPLGEWAYAPIVPTQAMGLTGGDDIEVVYAIELRPGIQLALEKLQGGEDPQLMALLVAEPLNPLVPHAVRVDLLVDRERTQAGYLPEAQSALFHELIKSAMDIGALAMMDVDISGGTAEKPDVVIRLVHFADDVERPSVTDELIARTNQRRELERERT